MRLFLYGWLLLLLLPFGATAQVPVAGFTASVTQGCAPLLVQFNNTSTGTNSGTTYSWNFNVGGGSVVLKSPSVTFTNPGTYTVTLVVTNPGAGGGSNTKTITNYITVIAPPAVSWTATDTTGCPPHVVSFNNTTSPASGVTYLWSFGDGSTSSATSPSHNYTTSGTYSVTLLATNSNGCSKTVVRPGNVRIWSKPQAIFAANPTTPCSVPVTVAFTSGVSGGQQPYNYAWTFGNGTTSTVINPVVTYTGAGPYSVRLIVTDGRGCADTLLKPNYIQSTNTQANFSYPVVCAGSPVTFTNTSAPVPTAAQWNFGSGAIPSTSTAISPTTTFAAPGTYSVQLITTGLGGCRDTTIKLVTIAGGPTVDFTASNTNPCSAPATVNFSNGTIGGTSYEWHFGDGGSSTATNPSHTYNRYGLFTDTLIATNAAGCTSRLIKPQYIKIRDIISKVKPNKTEGCVPLTVDFKHELETSGGTPPPPYPFGITSYSWTFGVPGATSNASQPTYTFTAPGIYTVRVTSVTSNGCTVTDSVIIKVGTKPVAGFTYAPPVQCANQPIQFTNTSTGAQDYRWEMGNGITRTETSPEYSYPEPGTYTVILKAFNNGCYDSMKITNAVTINPPNATFEVNYNCDTPKKVEFVNQSLGATSQLWNFGDGSSSTVAQPFHTYASLGNYTVTLITFNSTYGCSDTLEKAITLISGTASFVADDTTICTGDTVRFTGSFAGGTATRYKWGFQSGSTWIYDTASRVTNAHKFTTRGKFGVQLIVTNAIGCPDTVTRAGYITAARPLVGFKVSDSVGCVPFKPLFTDTSKNAPGVAGAIRNWRWGNGATSTVLKDTTSYTYNTAGNYTVTLLVTDSLGCTDSLTKVAYVSARKPRADFTINDTSACGGQQILFTNTTVGTAPFTTLWSFGNGATSTVTQPLYAYSAAGSYNVKLVVTDAAGCKDSITKTPAVTVTRPVASFSVSDSQAICPPLLAQFTNTSTNGASSYSWNFNNGSTSVLPNPSVVYTAIGLYPARLVAYDAQGCTDTAYRNIRVLGFAGALTYSPLQGCSPLQVQFNTTVFNAPSLIWDFDDGVTAVATGNTTTHKYNAPGAYVPRLLISDGNGCVTSSTGLDTIKVDGIRPGFINTPACLGSPITFTDTSRSFFSNITSRIWRFPNGLISTALNPTHPANGTGSFAVVLISRNANGCTDSITQQVNITPPPVINAGGDTSVCLNDAVSLGATGGVSYLWSPAFSLSNAGIPNPKASPTANTTYSVTGTDANGCTGKDSVFVRVKTKTTAATGGDVKVCAGSSVQLTGMGGTQYNWSPAGSLDNPASATPFAKPAQNTTYSVIVREGSCIPDTAQVKVVVNPTPKVDAGPDLTLVSGSSITIVTNSVDAEIFRWTPAENLGCPDCAATSASPAVTTTYRLLGTNKYGCSDSDEVTILVQCNGSQAFIPNTFTPNGDGENDMFYPHGSGITQVVNMRIYNRWGEVVFQKSNFMMNDKSAGWDGSFKGQPLPPDAFIYTIDALCPNGENISWKGDVTLIR